MRHLSGKLSQRLKTGTALLALLTAAGPTLAQDQDSNEERKAVGFSVEEITVTAQKRESTVIDTPIAVSAVGGAEIDRAQTRDVRDIQTLVPSLQVSSFASASNTSFSLRGIGSSTFNFGIEPAVGVFVDGVYRSRNGASISDFLGLERVEVLRGPQSTLFGKNTTAGVVNFITKEPGYEYGMEGELTYGRFNQQIFKGAVEGGLVDDVVAVRLDAYSNTRDGFVQDVSQDRGVNERDRWGLRGQTLVEPNENLKIRIIADYNSIQEACCAAPFSFISPQAEPVFDALGITRFEPTDPFSGETAIDGNVLADIETWGFSGQIDYDFENFTVTSITAWRNYNELQDIDPDFTDAPLNGERILNQRYDTFSQEIRFTSTGDGPLRWMTGAYYFNQDLVAGNRTAQGPLLRPFGDLLFSTGDAAAAAEALRGFDSFLQPVLGFSTGGSVIRLIEGLNGLPANTYLGEGSGLQSSRFNQENETFGIFAQLDYDITDRLTITGGIRYTNDRRDLRSRINIDDPFAALNLVGEFAGDFEQLIDAATTGAIVQGGLAAGLPLDLASDPAVNPGFANFAAIRAGAVAPQFEPLRSPLLGLYAALSALQFFPPAPNVSGEREDDDISGNIIVAYDVNDDLNVYASYTAGFKGGGFALDPAAARVGDFTFDPETVDAWEIGFKGRFFDDTVTANVAAFTQKVNDFQANVFTGTSFVPDNAGSINISGLEFDGSWTPSSNWQFTGAFAWLFEREYGEFPNGPCPAIIPPDVVCTPTIPAGGVVPVNVQDLGGREVSGTAEFRGTLTGTYIQPVGDDYQFYIRGEMSYTSPVFLTTELDPRQIQDDFALVAGSFGFGHQDGSWELQFYLRNAFNARYLQGSFNSTVPGGNLNAYPGDPLTFGGTLRFRF